MGKKDSSKYWDFTAWINSRMKRLPNSEMLDEMNIVSELKDDLTSYTAAMIVYLSKIKSYV